MIFENRAPGLLADYLLTAGALPWQKLLRHETLLLDFHFESIFPQTASYGQVSEPLLMPVVPVFFLQILPR